MRDIKVNFKFTDGREEEKVVDDINLISVSPNDLFYKLFPNENHFYKDVAEVTYKLFQPWKPLY